ncbi:response regulator transcription factor [Microbacterium sp. W4I20]|uniref:response regulator transcription factor n=1 Tax=Microbacterium sp. W4I20 TaxID=3042262 RepID=UPI0027D7E97D|nr:LuxR C-terminal-related transcriptional regulator [Microbacterium sp. W4I20]
MVEKMMSRTDEKYCRRTQKRAGLTARQVLVLQGLDQGLTLRQIGARQHLSVNTMKTHAKALYRRLGVNNRDEALARAHDLGLL